MKLSIADRVALLMKRATENRKALISITSSDTDPIFELSETISRFAVSSQTKGKYSLDTR
jgi:hypothetical protein